MLTHNYTIFYSKCKVFINEKHRNTLPVLFVNGGEGWIRTTEGSRRQIYSLVHLATLVPHLAIFSENCSPEATSTNPVLAIIRTKQDYQAEGQNIFSEILHFENE